MIELKNITWLLLITLLVSCSEYPYNSREEIDTYFLNNTATTIALIIENDIYLIRDAYSAPEQITFSSNEIKTNLKINYNNEKLVYLNADGTPVIIDIQGEILEVLSEYTNVQFIDWCRDNKSLYLLINNSIAFHGEEVNIPEISFPQEWVYGEKIITSFSLGTNGTIAYAATCESSYSAPKYAIIKKDFNEETSYYLRYHFSSSFLVSLSGDDNYLMIAYRDGYGGEEFKHIDVYSTNTQPRYTLEGTFSSPVLNRNKNKVVVGEYESNESKYFINTYNFTSDHNWAYCYRQSATKSNISYVDMKN